MSVQKISVLVPPLRAVPDAAAVIADAAAWLVARVETFAGNVAAAQREHREARSRALLIAMARRYEATQPGFAKDLYAAAADYRRS